jgi:hypothetical protein
MVILSSARAVAFNRCVTFVSKGVEETLREFPYAKVQLDARGKEMVVIGHTIFVC